MPSAPEQDFNPYYKWLGIPVSEQPPNHYRLLGIEKFESDVDVIESAIDRQMSFLRQFATGPQGELSQRLMNEISAARLVLVVDEKRQAYDEELRRAAGAPSSSVTLDVDEDAALAPEDERASTTAEPTDSSGPLRIEPASGGGTYSVEKGETRTGEAVHRKRLEKFNATRQKIEKLEEAGRLPEAKPALEKMAAVNDPRLHGFAKWAQEKLEVIGFDPEEMRDRADSLEEVGRQLIERYDFDQGIQILEEIPPKFRSESYQQLLDDAITTRNEIDYLDDELRRAVEEGEVDNSLLPTIEALLKLKPVHTRARELYERLTGKSADRFVPRSRRRKRRKKGAGLPGLPGVPVRGILVGLGLLLFVVVGGWALLSFVRDAVRENSELAKLGRLRLNLSESLRSAILEDGLVLSIDGKEINAENIDDEIPLEGGPHELVVKKGKKAIHEETILVTGGDVAEIALNYDDGKIGSVVTVALSEEPLSVPDGPPGEVHTLGKSDKKSRNNPTRLAVSDNGRYLVSRAYDGTLTLWDLSKGEPIRKIRPGRRTYSFALAPGGTRLAAVGDGNPILLFDLETGKSKQKLEGHSYPPTALAYSPDGETLVSFAGGADRTIRAWDLGSGDERWSWNSGGTAVNGMTFSPDGGTLLANVDDSTVLLDAATGEPRRRVDALWPATINEGGLVVGRSHGGIPLAWNVETGGEFARLEGVPNDRLMAVSADGRLVATPATAERRLEDVVVWNAVSGKEVARFKGHERPLSCLSFTPDGGYVVSGGQAGTIRLWRLPSVESGEITPTPLADAGKVGETRRVSFAGAGPSASGDGKLVAVVQGGVGKVFDVETGALRTRTPVHDAKLARLSADGRYLVTAANATLRFWDVTTGKGVLRAPCPGRIVSFQLSEDGQTVGVLLRTSSQRSGLVASVIEIETGHERQRLPVPSGRAAGVAFSRDLGRMVVADGARVNVISLADGSSLGEHVFLAPGDQETPVEWVTITSTGDRVVAACADRTVRTWEVGSDEDVGTLRIGDGLVGFVASDDASRILVATDDLKQLDTKAEIATEPFSSVEFVPKSIAAVPGRNSLVLAGEDDTLHLFRLPDDANGTAFRAVSSAEPYEYAPDAGDVGVVRRIDAHRGSVSDVTFSHGTGRDVVSVAYGDRAVRVWNIDTSESVRELETNESTMTRLATAPSLVVIGKSDGEFLAWNLATGNETKWSTELGAPIASIAMAPDGSWLTATASDERKPVGKVVRIPTDTGQVGWTVQRAGKRAGQTQVSGDGETLTVELDGTVTALSAEDGSVQRWFGGDRLAAIARNGDVVVTVEGNVVRIWDGPTGRERGRLEGFDLPPTGFALSPDGERLVTVDQNGSELRLWHLPSGRQIGTLGGKRANAVTCVAIHPEGHTVAYGERGGTVGLWIPKFYPPPPATVVPEPAPSDLPEREGIVRTFRPMGTGLGRLAVGPSGQLFGLATGSVVKVFDLRSEGLVFKSPAHDRPVTSITISADNSTVVTTTDNALYSWDRMSGRLRSKISTTYARDVRVTPDGAHAIAVCGGDGRRTKPLLSVFDLEAGKELRRLAEGVRADYTGPALSPDGKTYAVFDAERIRRFDVETGDELPQLVGHEVPKRRSAISSRVAFSEAGDKLFSLGPDSTYRIWNLSDGSQDSVLGFTAQPTRIVFTGDGTVIAATRAGLEFYVPEAGEIPDPKRPPAHPPMRKAHTFAELPGTVTGLKVVPGSPHLVVLSDDGRVRFLGMPTTAATSAELD